jgi:hypothetical protein
MNLVQRDRPQHERPIVFKRPFKYTQPHYYFDTVV